MTDSRVREALIGDLNGFHDDLEPAGRMRVYTESECEQTRLNLRAVLRDAAAALASETGLSEADGIKWRRVNEQEFEYAIQQGPFGDEFVKLLDGNCLRRPISRQQPAAEAGAFTSPSAAEDALSAWFNSFPHEGGTKEWETLLKIVRASTPGQANLKAIRDERRGTSEET